MRRASLREKVDLKAANKKLTVNINSLQFPHTISKLIGDVFGDLPGKILPG